MKDRNQKILSSIISIFIGLVVGGILVLAVGLLNSKIGIKGAWEGVRIIVPDVHYGVSDDCSQYTNNNCTRLVSLVAGTPRRYARRSSVGSYTGTFQGAAEYQ